MDELKSEFKLECECGLNTFYISHDLNDYKYEIRCAECGRVVGSIPPYGIEWVKKEK